MRRTESYRVLLDKLKKSQQEASEKLFLSIEMILDNIDQEYAVLKERQAKKANEKQSEV